MLELADKIELKSTDAKDEISFATRYMVQVNLTFDLTVRSGKFSGTSHFCIRKDQIEKLCTDLIDMTSSNQGHTKIEDNDSNAFVEFTMSKDGLVHIKGQIGGTHEENYLMYEFSTDNIATDIFIKEFGNMLDYVDDAEYEKEYNLKHK